MFGTQRLFSEHFWIFSLENNHCSLELSHHDQRSLKVTGIGGGAGKIPMLVLIKGSLGPRPAHAWTWLLLLPLTGIAGPRSCKETLWCHNVQNTYSFSLMQKRPCEPYYRWLTILSMLWIYIWIPKAQAYASYRIIKPVTDQFGGNLRKLSAKPCKNLNFHERPAEVKLPLCYV